MPTFSTSSSHSCSQLGTSWLQKLLRGQIQVGQGTGLPFTQQKMSLSSLLVHQQNVQHVEKFQVVVLETKEHPMLHQRRAPQWHNLPSHWTSWLSRFRPHRPNFGTLPWGQRPWREVHHIRHQDHQHWECHLAPPVDLRKPATLVQQMPPPKHTFAGLETPRVSFSQAEAAEELEGNLMEAPSDLTCAGPLPFRHHGSSTAPSQSSQPTRESSSPVSCNRCLAGCIQLRHQMWRWALSETEESLPHSTSKDTEGLARHETLGWLYGRSL